MIGRADPRTQCESLRIQHQVRVGTKHLGDARLNAIADTQHSKLSAGQRRRLALAIALTRDAKLWLLDEPHAGLDADGRALLDEIVVHAPSRGVTVLFASHELDRARVIATREVRVERGRLHTIAQGVA